MEVTVTIFVLMVQVRVFEAMVAIQLLSEFTPTSWGIINFKYPFLDCISNGYYNVWVIVY